MARSTKENQVERILREHVGYHTENEVARLIDPKFPPKVRASLKSLCKRKIVKRVGNQYVYWMHYLK